MLPKPHEICSGCPLYELPHGKKIGFSVPDGTGKNGVMIVAEALGKDEEQVGKGLIGMSGYTLFQDLKRIDIERDDFTIFNTIACRPPDNKLIGMPYEKEAIAHCAPNLDRAIADAKAIAKANGKTFTIVTLGKTAFMRVMDFNYKSHSQLLKKDYYVYPFWSDTYGCWVLNAPHPAYLLRGNTKLWPIVRFVFKRALEIANEGFRFDDTDYLLDPNPDSFGQWADGYFKSLQTTPDNPLSYDIETPYKKKVKDEEEMGEDDTQSDHTILRCSFSYFQGGETYTTSVRWSAEYMSTVERLFRDAPFVLGWNSDKYDYPRVSRYVKVNGISLDGMVAWHILQSALPKALGFVTPFYWQKTSMWKHMADDEPAFYNAKDADAALRNWIGIKRDLINNKLWDVYNLHWIELAKALKYMSGKGVLRDSEMRQDAEIKMSTILDDVETRMEAAVPDEARAIKIYKKTPKVIKSGMYETSKDYPATYCAKCGVDAKGIRSKKWHNKCEGAEITTLMIPQMVWAEPLPFKVSKKRLTSYQGFLKHQAIIDRKERKVTFNADAITKLVKQYPKDPLYPTILEHRKVNKLLSTYVGVTDDKGRLQGGMPVGTDGRIHTVYGRDASTLRFTSEDPNLHNLPRPNVSDPNDLANIIRKLIIAQDGYKFGAVDYAGIEAVLTGYFALDPEYIRLAKVDVHSYYTAYALYELEGGSRIQASDLPDITWPDDRLFPYLNELKKVFKYERNSLYKHLVHAANFMQGANGAAAKIYSETGIDHKTKDVQKVMDVYFTLFPKIRQWHWNVLEQVDKDGFLRNPFGYICWFSRAFDRKKEFGEWTKKPGADANRIIACGPQSTAVGIITEAILELFHRRFEEAGQYLRLQVHDELLFEAPIDIFTQVMHTIDEVMGRPVPQLRLPSSWNMGEYLSINTESKEGFRWGEMK